MILQLSASELSRKIKAGEITAPEAAEAALAQIRACEGTLNSFITWDEEDVRRQAMEVEQGIREGRFSGPLAGVPVAVKDNLCTRGMRTTCASRMLESFVPSYEAEAVARLRRAGALILGKTNMDEFAMGSTSETSAFGPVKNPWNPAYAPGGSSGGSCSAVASGEAFCALGSDTGGSIRQPSAYCGVVGLKPTYGRVSRYGLVAYASSMDQIGPIARSVEDCAVLLEAIAGRDEKDSTSRAQENTGFAAAVRQGAAGLRIGIPRDCFAQGQDPETERAVRAAAQALAEQGAVLEDFDLGILRYAVPAYYIIACAEASSNLARFDGIRYGFRTEEKKLLAMYNKTRANGFGAEVKRRIMLGTLALSADYYEACYQKALRTKACIVQAFKEAFARYDLILCPSAPSGAPVLGQSLKGSWNREPSDIDTVAANLAGLPGISVPCGLSSRGMPVGVQLLAGWFQEKKLLAAAGAYEKSRRFPLCPMLLPPSKEMGREEAGAGRPGEEAGA